LQELFLLALGSWLVARQPLCLVRHQKLCAAEGLPYQLSAWVICCPDKSGDGNKLKAAQTGSAVALLLFPIRVILGTTQRQDVRISGGLSKLNDRFLPTYSGGRYPSFFRLFLSGIIISMGFS
jgi:hypothetical protein